MQELAIVTHGLTKHYRNIHAVEKLDLHVPAGAIYAFLGRNGAGKTTTMKMLLGLVKPTGGSAEVLGFDIRGNLLSILKSTGFVGENKTLYPSLTGSDLVRFNRQFYPTWSDRAARKYIQRLEVPMDRPWGSLSQGNRTKVSLLLALAQGADLLFLDEPTTGLDPVTIDNFFQLLVDDFTKAGRTVFFSSHQLAEVEQITDWVGILDGGRLLLESSAMDIQRNFRMVITENVHADAVPSGHALSAGQDGGCWRFIIECDADRFVEHLRQKGATIKAIVPLTLQQLFLMLVRK